ncbi:uncharacterized protein LOC112572805 isoform X2 [Pomacea canaliculata]|uniref:uncharacterized protein LOC112572805 isoform X2 n=1 Tax=Pomacea canaliculata TaxID=400727 RepID=UPI000D728D42|nr:uncharacterized protein LOC112572805 isoform X2 [Pomacea canaliculata]
MPQCAGTGTGTEMKGLHLSKGQPQKEKWSFQNMEEVNRAASCLLRVAMLNERSKRWTKVMESYKQLLWLVDKSHFPKDYEPPSSYAMLTYELHSHLAVALQRMGQHREAVNHLTSAIKVVSIPKGGCLAGCVTNSCLMTPVYARRAFAYARLGEVRNALRDAEKSVVLDSQNPDVYCIRALVRGSREEEALAIKDADFALKLNPSHLCALVIRGALSRTLDSEDKKGKNIYQLKAEKLNPESQTFNTVGDFHHPHILDFYDRYLFTLSVPHTMTEINLTPDKPSKQQMDLNPEFYSRCTSRASSRPTSHRSERAVSEPFRCGAPSAGHNMASARRRRDYGAAVRRFLAKPQTAEEYIASLEKERQKHNKPQPPPTPSLAPRHVSSPEVSSDTGVMTASSASSPSSLSKPLKGMGTSQQSSLFSASHVTCSALSSSCTEGPSQRTGVGADVCTRAQSGRSTRTCSTKTFVFQTPDNYTIPVFQPMNIKDAPRMYYRPWKGDKLPVADAPRPQTSPPFY